jgi:hypothetical protein
MPFRPVRTRLIQNSWEVPEGLFWKRLTSIQGILVEKWMGSGFLRLFKNAVEFGGSLSVLQEARLKCLIFIGEFAVLGSEPVELAVLIKGNRSKAVPKMLLGVVLPRPTAHRRLTLAGGRCAVQVRPIIGR